MSTVQIPTAVLPTGAPIPVFGFGTYKVTSGVYETVSSALALGYRHIDTAQMYGNEAEVGRAIADSGVPREELFITSKLDNGNHEPAAARASFDKTLADLRTDYVDLFLIHWPLPTLYGGDVALPWPVLEEFHAQGRARAIGLSNYTIEHIERVLDAAEVAPHVLQVEAHPFFPNNEVRDFARAHGMTTQAWSPLARGRAAKDPALARIAASIGRTGPQVALRWALDRGDIVFPKSVTPTRQAENLDVFSFTLPDSLRARIDALDEGEAGRTGSHPDTMNRL
ncbi:MAG: aldo/keto reductase [Schaalia hyovaginalis]|uniref:aldo/keto reductase n=1 Tax=Schaalia hyovaginalis TaxID=29316 RepID=UPI002A91D69B|nr:aldo/keto reductase [Schaalia hyovaginalis]MDY5601951.1 aldo/keto reductase [Schaalia hyovaginalis]